MIVKQLIDKLRKLPENLPCVIYDPDTQQYGHLSVIEQVSVGVVRVNPNIVRMENFRPGDHAEERKAIRIN